jgi:hypothetical protein
VANVNITQVDVTNVNHTQDADFVDDCSRMQVNCVSYNPIRNHVPDKFWHLISSDVLDAGALSDFSEIEINRNFNNVICKQRSEQDLQLLSCMWRGC